ncbi:hypothetical protein Tco_1461942 [Tanacetum coccineum]
MSPGNVAREGIPFELFRSTYPGRHVARERYPQRQVARDTSDLSLGNIANVVLMLRLNSSLGPSTPPSYFLGPITPPSYSPGPSIPATSLEKAECSNCKFLAAKIKILEAKNGKASR